MADLDFSHNVSEIPAGETVPTPYRRSVSAEVTPQADLQSAFSNYAANTNWMSSIGSTIASKSANAIAIKLGNELGQKPKGNIGLPITDFDRVMLQNYSTQAQATLGLQANKLIADSNIQIAKATRITPGLIEQTNKSISLGLQNIFKNAPDEIRPALEHQYQTLQLNQTVHLTERMIQEQKEDQRNNSALASQMNAEHAYSFGLSGNDKQALAVVESTRRLNEANVAARITTPVAAKDNIDTANKSYIKGKLIHDYEKARSEGKGEEFLKSLADKKPSYIKDNDYLDVTRNLMSYVGQQTALRSQDEQLRVAQFHNTLADGLNSADLSKSTVQLQELKENVSPIAFERAQLSYKKAFSMINQDQAETNEFIEHFSNAEVFSKASTDLKNRTFDKLVNGLVQNSQSNGSPINRDDAEVIIAASAAGPIPSFVNSLNAKAGSGDPVSIESAAAQVHSLRESEAGRVIQGLSDSSNALFTKYEKLRAVMPPVEAARIATDTVYNKTDKDEKEYQQSWSNMISKNTKNGIVHSEYALKIGGNYSVSDFITPSIAHVYGTSILDTYKTYYTLLNGDDQAAIQNVRRVVKENYGPTYINGDNKVTLHPIEKVLGYGTKDVVPFIQQDMIEQFTPKFAAQKAMYDDKKSDEYWEVVPEERKNHALLFGQSYNPVKVQRVFRSGNEEKKELYDVVLQGNAFNTYDVSIRSSSGIIPIFQKAPFLGITTYSPRKQWIDNQYNKNHH